MSIAIFEIRGDESRYVEKFIQESGVEAMCFSEPLSKEHLSELKGVDGISMLSGTKLDRDLLKGLSEVGIKKIAMRVVGLDHVDLVAAKEYQIHVTGASYPPDAVADFTVMLMLIALRKYKPALWKQQVNDYSLPGLKGRNLSSLTIGVIGAGRIGEKVIDNLSGFGSKILVYKRNESLHEESRCTYVDLDTLYRESDVITIHIPLREDTRGMINAETLSKMKDQVVLINTSRGELMNIQDMIEGIETEKIGALAMDVFENDMTIYHNNRTRDIIKNREMAYIRQFPNVILTQHMAFYTEESVEGMVNSSLCALWDKR